MRICLLSLTYPPESTEGIARQRQILATTLVNMGHEVHVITCGSFRCIYEDQGVQVHNIPINTIDHFSSKYPNLNQSLNTSQALYMGLRQLQDRLLFDIIDTPLWALQGLVTLQYSKIPAVLWLQTTTAQLTRINKKTISPNMLAMMALERSCFDCAQGIVADSHSILEHTIYDYQLSLDIPTGIAHLGLPASDEPLSDRDSTTRVEALVVGRLEKRKGTHILFSVLPALLYDHPQLTVRFVGRDNSSEDGWKQQHGLDYPTFFQKHYPDVAHRVMFENYVSDEKLTFYYQHAHMLLVPSLYESFGLIYLEAMRAGLPIITFAVGGAQEIFAQGEADGALLVPPDDQNLFVAAIKRLIHQPNLRAQLGKRGFQRFKMAFSAEQMALDTLRLYEQALEQTSRIYTNEQPIYQVMEALDVGDAVSNITRYNAQLLSGMKQPSTILSRYTHPDLKKETRPIHHSLTTPHCGIIFHYWGYNTSTWLIQALRGPKAIHYHNITPPHYFPTNSEAHHAMKRGYNQLSMIADRFNLIIGDSQYNITELSPYINTSKPSLPIYPVIDVKKKQSTLGNTDLFNHIRQSYAVNIVFVGRIARNKRQDQIMRLFDYYYQQINRHAHLWLVGSQNDSEYTKELEALKNNLFSGHNITFTGKVSEPDVHTYYRIADVFVCASEHEGFCMPIAEAMALNIPVIAYAAAAVPETMGQSGILIHRWDIPHIAELMHLVITEQTFRQKIVAKQITNLHRFSVEEVQTRMHAVIRYLRMGEISPLFKELHSTVPSIDQELVDITP